jgi:lipopolysaccharide/colanic/teichoic acid biosynthesis glycosyltransferase
MSAVARNTEHPHEAQTRGSLVGDSDLDWALESAPYWPVTRLVAWSLTLAVAIVLAVPPALTLPQGTSRLVLILPAIFATFGARSAFETLGVATGHRGLVHRLVAALIASFVGCSMVAGVCLVVAGSWSAPASAASAALGAVTFLAAGAARELEIRLRRSLRRVFFAGSPDSRRDLERELSRRPDARLVGTLRAGTAGDADGIAGAVLATDATVLVLDSEAMHCPETVHAASRLNLAGVRVRDLVSYYESEFRMVPVSEISPTWFLFDIASIHRRRAYRALRRGVDVVVAVTLLALTLPVLLLVALAIRLESRGPAIYRQRRVGRGGTEFVLLKLRTMREPGQESASWAVSEGHRITAVGAFLRRFRVDELPQLWNVVRGDLALIGPRPEQVPIAALLGREVAHYNARHCIRPGITGWAQVNLGYAGTLEGAVAKLQRDLYYVKHSSPRLDCLIVWLTLKAVLVGPDATGPQAFGPRRASGRINEDRALR